MKRTHSKAKSTMAMVLALSMTLQQSSVITLAEDLALQDLQEAGQDMASDPPIEADISEGETQEPLADQEEGNVLETGEAEPEQQAAEDQQPADQQAADQQEADTGLDLPEPASAADDIENTEFTGEDPSAYTQDDLNDFVPEESSVVMEAGDARTDSEFLTEFLYSENGITATVYAEEAAEIPADAQFHIEPVEKDSSDYTEMDARIRTELGYGERAELDYLPFEMYFTASDSEEKVESKDGLVSVVLTFDEPVSLGEHAAPVKSTAVAHEGENGYESLKAYEEFKLIDYVQTEREVEQRVEETASLLEEDGVAEQAEYTEEQVGDAGSVAESDAENEAEDGSVVEEDAAAAETAETPADAPEPAVQADPAQNTKKVYDILVNGISFTTTRFSKFSGVVEYEEETAEDPENTEGTKDIEDTLEATEVEDFVEIPKSLKTAPRKNQAQDQDLAFFLRDLTIEGMELSEDGKSYTVIEGKQYNITLRFEENEFGDYPDGQFGTGKMYYEIPTGLTIPQKDEITETNPKEISVKLEGVNEDGSNHNVKAKWWFGSDGKIWFEWMLEEGEQALFEKCFNTYIELDMKGIIEKEEVDWKGDIGTKKYEFDRERELEVNKTVGEFQSSTNTVHYTIEVWSKKGQNRNVVVTDEIPETSQEFLEFDPGIMNFTVKKDGTLIENSTWDENSLTPSSFEKTFDLLEDGQKVTIEYDVKLKNIEDLQGATVKTNEVPVSLGTHEQTNNTVHVTSDDIEEATLKMSDEDTDLVGKITVEGLQKGRPTKSVVVEDGVPYAVLDWTITLQSRPEPALNIGGRTITDELNILNAQAKALTEYYGDITVMVKGASAAEDAAPKASWTVKKEDISWGTDRKSWSFTIPEESGSNPVRETATEADGNYYIYTIKYATRTRIDELVEDKTIGNTGRGYGSGTGQGTVGPSDLDNKFELRKSVASRTKKDNGQPGTVTWLVELDVPAIGLDGETYLIDLFPTDGTHRDTYVDNSLRVENLEPGEDYTWSFVGSDEIITTDSSKVAGIRIDFTKGSDPSKTGGLLAKKRTIKVYLTTQNSTEKWTKIVDGSEVHDNNAKVSNNKISTGFVTASVISNPRLEKRMEVLKTTLDGLPVVKNTVKLYGPITDTFTLEDVFDKKLAYINASDDISRLPDDHEKLAYDGGTATGTVTAAPDNANHKVNFTISGFKKADKVDTYTLTYYLKVKDKDTLDAMINQALMNEDHKVSIGNKITSDMFIGDEATTTYEYSPVDKIAENKEQLGPENRVVHFTIDINREGRDLDPNSEWLIVPDEYDSAISVDYNSIRIKEGDEGTTGYTEVTASNNVPGDHSYWDGSGHKIIYTIPDNKHIVITYDATVTGWGNVSANNTVTVMGYSKTERINKDFRQKERAGGSTYKIQIKKYEDGNMRKPIAGVQFNVYEDTGIDEQTGRRVANDNNYIKTVTTDKSGMAVVDGLRRNKYYFLEEVRDDEKIHNRYRYDSVQYLFRIAGDGSYDYATYTYQNNDILTVRNETINMDIPVSKIWVGGDANNRPKVTFKLQKAITDNSGNITGYEDVSDVSSLELPYGDSWTSKFENIPRRDSNGNLITYRVIEEEVSGYIPDGGKRVDDSRPNRIDKGIVFTNVAESENKGTIKVSKTVVQTQKQGDYFTIKIKPDENNQSLNLKDATVTGTLISDIQEHEITLQIKHGETVIVGNLPYGKYLVEEQGSQDANAKYKATYLVTNSDAEKTTSTENKVVLGDNNHLSTVAVTNDFIEHPEQKLTIQKSVIGGPATAYTKEYKVRIRTANIVGESYQYIQALDSSTLGTNPVEFSLKQSEPLVVSVPVGTYVVEEVEDSVPISDYKYLGYTVDATLPDGVVKTENEGTTTLTHKDGTTETKAQNESSTVVHYPDGNDYPAAKQETVPAAGTQTTVTSPQTSGMDSYTVNQTAITFGKWDDRTATLKNEYEVYKGTLEIKKEIKDISESTSSVVKPSTAISGLGNYNTKKFKVMIMNAEDQYLHVDENDHVYFDDVKEPYFTVSVGTPLRIENVPVGTGEYTVTEVREDANDWEISNDYDFVIAKSTTNVKNVNVTYNTETKDPNTTTVNLVNSYKHKSAKILVRKNVSLDQSSIPENDRESKINEFQELLNKEASQKKYTFKIERIKNGNWEVVDTLEVRGNGKAYSSKELPTGETYKVVEVAPAEPDTTVVKDFIFESSVIKEQNENQAVGEIQLQNPNENKSLIATNTYKKAPYIRLEGNKLLNNGSLSENHFDFALYEVINGTEKKVGSSVSSDINGHFVFPEISYKTEGSHTYIIREVIPQAADPSTKIYNGIKYDTARYKVEVTVTKDSNGELQISIIQKKIADDNSETTADTIAFTNEAVETKIQKYIADSSNPTPTPIPTGTPGVKLRLKRDDGGKADANGNISGSSYYTWTTVVSDSKSFYGLKDGTYTLEEIEALPGYYLTSVTFEVVNGKVSLPDELTDGQAEAKQIENNDGYLLKLINKKTHFTVRKLDNDPNGNEQLLGAKLQIFKAEDFNESPLNDEKALTISDSNKYWTSGSDQKIEGLEVGQEYVLYEKEAPYGYDKFEPLHFKIKYDNTIEAIGSHTNVAVTGDAHSDDGMIIKATDKQIRGHVKLTKKIVDGDQKAVMVSNDGTERIIKASNGTNASEKDETADFNIALDKRASFNLYYRKDGSGDYGADPIASITTKSDGTWTSENNNTDKFKDPLANGDETLFKSGLPTGYYKLVETNENISDDVYGVNTQAIEFEIRNTADDKYNGVDPKKDLSLDNTLFKASVKLTKYDADTNPFSPMPGVEFTLSKIVTDKNNQEEVQFTLTGKTTSKGEIVFENLPKGTYLLEEKVSSTGSGTGNDGYDLTGQRKFDNLPFKARIEISSDNTNNGETIFVNSDEKSAITKVTRITQTSTNNKEGQKVPDGAWNSNGILNYRSLGSITLTKKDAKTTLNGVKFELWKKSDSNNAYEKYWDNVVETGYSYSEPTPEEKAANTQDPNWLKNQRETKRSGEQGVLYIQNLPWGDYKLVETETLDGHVMYSYDSSKSEDPKYKGIEVEFKIERGRPQMQAGSSETVVNQPTRLEIIKKNLQGTILTGAVFNVHGKFVGDTQEIDHTVNANSEGKYILEGDLIAGQTYTLTETTAPAGYKLPENKNKVCFTIDQYGVISQLYNSTGDNKEVLDNNGYALLSSKGSDEGFNTITIKDEPIKVTIKKEDSSSHSLAGATFRITPETGSFADGSTTAKEISITDTENPYTLSAELCLNGVYTVEEITAPFGYKKHAKNQVLFKLKVDGEGTVSVIDILNESDGANGTSVTSAAAPTPTPQAITTLSDRAVTVKDDPLQQIAIYKRDKENSNALQGVEFKLKTTGTGEKFANGSTELSLISNEDGKLQVVKSRNENVIEYENGSDAFLISQLRTGYVYELTEVEKASLYKTMTPVQFHLTENGIITLNGTYSYASVKSNGLDAGLVLTVNNERKATTVLLTKIDKDTNTGIPGVMFKLWKKDSSGSYQPYLNGSSEYFITSANSSDLGVLTITGLPWGEYKLVEWEATGYKLPAAESSRPTFEFGIGAEKAAVNDGKQYMLTTSGNPAVLNLTPTDAARLQNEKNKLKLKKIGTDDASGTALEGAQFELYQVEAVGTTPATTATPYASTTASAAGTTRQLSWNTTDQVFEISAIPAGVYALKETEAPYGYKLDESWHYLTMNVDGTITISESDSVLSVNGETLSFSDAPISIKLVKEDATDSRRIGGIQFTMKPSDNTKKFAGNISELTLVSSYGTGSANTPNKEALGVLQARKSDGTYYTSAEFMKLLHVGYTYTLNEKEHVNNSLYKEIITDMNSGMNFTIGNDGKVTVDTNANGSGAMSTDANQLTVTVKNERKLTTVKLTKKADSEHGNVLPNVEFSLWKLNAGGNEYTKVTDTLHTNSQGNYVTDTNGVLTIPGLGWGQYKLVEEKATGYNLPDPRGNSAVTVKFAIGADAATITDSNVQKYVSAMSNNIFELNDVINTRNTLTIQKTNKDGSIALGGAIFRLYKGSKSNDNLYASSADSEVTATVRKLEESNGVFTINTIPDGAYILEEVKAPNGYEIQDSQESISFWMETNGSISWDNSSSADSAFVRFEAKNGTTPNTITVKDEFIGLTVRKESLASQGETATPLSDAVFKLEHKKDDGTFEDVSDHTSLTTGDDGQVGIGSTDIIHGETYRLTETKAPAGYILYDPAPSVTFTVQKNGKVTFTDGNTLEVSNQYKITGSGTDTITFSERKTKLTIHKVDNETGAALDGATLEIYRAEDFNPPSGTAIGSPKTNVQPVWTGDSTNKTSAGVWIVEGLDAGTDGKDYYLYEKTAPSGYEKFVSFKFMIHPDNQVTYIDDDIQTITTSTGNTQRVSEQIAVSGSAKNTSTLTIQAADTRIRGYVTIQKKIVNASNEVQSQRTPFVSGTAQSGVSLNKTGITFDLYYQNGTSNEKIAENLKTDGNGTWSYENPNADIHWINSAFSHGLPTGNYYFIETSSTEDLYYGISDHKYSFTIGDTGTNAHLETVTPDVKNELFHADIQLTKLDWDAVNLGLTPTGMDGVAFKLEGPHADPTDTASNTISLTGTTSTVDGVAGVLKFSNLPKGTYELTETETLPVGYDSRGVRKSASGDKSEAFKALITITDADQNQTISVNSTTAKQQVTPVSGTARNKIQVQNGSLNENGILNYRSLGTIKVLKLSGDSTNSNERLNDATFELQVKNASGQYVTYWSGLLTGNTYTEYDPAKSQTENDRTAVTEGKEGTHKGILEIKDLPWGTYRLLETKGADGYGSTHKDGTTVSSADIVSVSNGFTIDAAHLAYDFTSDSDGLKNYKNKLTILKKDLNGTVLANAEFDLVRLTDSASGRSEETVRTGLKTSAQGKIELTGVLVSGETYKLHETKAPEGYELITEDIIFTVGNDGRLKVEDDSAYTSESSQEGYFLPDDANNYYAVTITAKDTPIRVSLVKKETGSDRLLEDFTFTVRPAAGSHFSGSASTTDGAVVINKENRLTALNGALSAGNTYEITETGVPEGYERAEKVTFTIDADGDVQILSGPASVSAYTPAASGSAADDLESQRITITDKPLTLAVAKAEMQEASGTQTSTTYLDGAKFRLAPESGSRFAKQGDETTAPSVLEFETAGGVPYEISRRLIIGNTYKLTETKSPAGYVLSSAPVPGITFKVKDDGTLEYETGKKKVASGEGDITIANTSDGTAAILFTDRKTKLQIKKVDNETGDVVRGATLKIYQGTLTETGALAEGALVKATLTDSNRNADGIWTVTGLDAGEATGDKAGVNYVLVEEKTPDGYDTFAPLSFTLYPDNHIQTHSEIRQITTSFISPAYDQEFVIAKDGNGKNGGTIDITAVDTRVRGHFHIEKLIASDTNNNVSERVPTPEMSGENGTFTLNKSAVFKLYVMKGTAPGQNDPCIATITTDKSTGIWQSRYLEDTYVDPDASDDSAKTRPFKDGLPVGKYYLKEIFSSKDMYYDEEAQDAVYRFDIAANQSAQINGHNSDQKQQITNTLFVASVEVTKLDWDAIDRGEAPKTISDAEFTLKGTDSENRGILLTAATDTDGKAVFTNLPKGTYELAEASGVSGYDLSGDRKEGEAKPFKATIIITDDSQNADGKHSITVDETTAKNSVTVRTFDQKADRVQTSPDVQITKSAGDWNRDGILNFRKLGSVKLGKEDGDTEEALNNAEFKLQKKTGSAGTDADYTDYLAGLQTGKVYYDIATRGHAADHTGTAGEKGVLLIHNLPWGTYRLVETKAADGYGITDKDGKVVTTQDFTISRDEKTHHPDLGTAENYKISLKLHKTGTQAKVPLAGAVFTLTGTYLNRSTTGESASAAVSSLSRSDDMGRVTGSLRLQSDRKGEISLDGVLIAGETYTLHEETAPEGYELMRTDLTFTVKEDGTVENAAGGTAPFAGTGTGYGSTEGYILTSNSRYAAEITAQDTRINVSIDKADAEDTKAAAGEAYQSLEGAKYKVTPASGSRFADASGLPIKDGAILIDDSNKDTALNGALLAGNTYILTETVPPAGYELAAPVTFTVNADGEVSIAAGASAYSFHESRKTGDGFEFERITVKDTPIKISLTKADMTDLNHLPIAGAKFELKSVDGSSFAKTSDQNILTIATEKEAVVIDRELIVGKTYTLTETKSPAGYVLSDPAPSVTFLVEEDGTLTFIGKPETVEKEGEITGEGKAALTEDGTAAVVFTDRQTKLTLKKVDNETGDSLDGATLQIYEAEGFAIDEKTKKPVSTAKKVWDSSEKSADRDADGIWTILGLDAGETEEAAEKAGTAAGVKYVLYEAVVPKGYEAFAPLTFTLYPNNDIKVDSEILSIETLASAVDQMAYTDQIVADPTGSKGGAALITAVDTRIRGHVAIDKNIVDKLVEGKEVSKRTTAVSGDDTQGGEITLKKAGVTFDLYTVKDGKEIRIARDLTISEDGKTSLTKDVNWTSEGNKKDTFKDPSQEDEETAFAKGLPAGDYYFLETKTTEDLLLDQTAKYEFTITTTETAEKEADGIVDGTSKPIIAPNDTAIVQIPNVFFHTDIEVTKLDGDSHAAGDEAETIEGAAFTLAGTGDRKDIILTGKTGEDGTLTFSNLPKGTYVLTEGDTLEGYDLTSARSADHVPFEAVITVTDADHNADGGHTIRVNQETAEKVVKDTSGTEVNQIQKTAGIWNEAGILNYRRPGSLSLKKVDADKQQALAGAEFELTGFYLDAEGNAVKGTQTLKLDSEEGITLEGVLIAGETYTLHESKAPEGYELIEKDLSFTLLKDGTLDAETEINEDGAGYVPVLEEPYQIGIVAQDHYSKFPVRVLKIDAGTQKALAGATLQILDSKGNVTAEWESTEESHEVQDLLPNEVYTLHEERAPKGYGTAGDTTFVLKKDGTFDAEKTVTRVNEDGVLLVEDGRLGATLSVTKLLVLEDTGEGLGAVDQTFYVQLFYDEACTAPVSEIRPLEYRNAVSATVVFDVDYGLTYYVKEVTEDGEPIDAGVVDEAIFVAVFDEDDNSVTIDGNGDGKASITFRNEFITVPSGFFYSHALTVTKQVRTASGEAKKTDEIFYAGIFADEGLTTLSDAVENQILPLEPGKEAQASATTTVAAMPGTVLTLFVAEVNADGKPVNEDETFAYTVTIDADSVTFTDEVNTAEVTITNTERPEITATPTPTVSPSPTPTLVPDGPFGPDTPYVGGSSKDTPRTGDDTDMAGYLAMLTLSGVLMLLLALRKTKKSKK